MWYNVICALQEVAEEKSILSVSMSIIAHCKLYKPLESGFKYGKLSFVLPIVVTFAHFGTMFWKTFSPFTTFSYVLYQYKYISCIFDTPDMQIISFTG